MGIAIERTSAPKPKPKSTEYGFGRFFSDHMYMVDYSAADGWHSPRIVPYQPLTLDPGAAVLHYGQAIFEGLKAFRGVDGKIRLFRPEMNWKRLTASADRLCMKAPDLPTYMEGLQQLVTTEREWVPTKEGTALYLRPTLIGTEAFLGVRPAEKYLYYVIASPVGAYYGDSLDSVKIWIEREYSRAAPGGIGAAKAGGNYASSLKAALEAKKRGYAQVLWTDAGQHKFVEEVGTMNVFFLIGDRVITPALSGTILPGVMRDSVIEVLRSWNLQVEERSVPLAEILEAHKNGELKEVFGTGTAAQVSPVSELGTEEQVYKIGSGGVGPLSDRLYTYFMELNYGRTKDTMGWLHEIC
ncbi:MAG: branched-chain amino acid aminotransferase [Bdellovibrionaceae bacterium]|nr:branched-chain amino acid aminotransferase [Pseudobdellovibrionaceae bacterium]